MEDLKLATSAIALIIFLVVPGISFKGGYYTQRFKDSLNSGSFQDRLVSTIFISILFQICIILVNNYLFDQKINFDTYTAFLTEDLVKSNNKINLDFTTLSQVIKYLIFCSVFPFVIGFIFNKLICLFNLDRHISYLRSNDFWHYYFRGNIPNDNSNSKKLKGLKITSTIVDVLVETPNDTRLYSGYYVTHTLKKNSADLDSIILTDVERYSDNQKCFVNVPGHYFKIKGDKLININTRHIINELHKNSNSKDPIAIIAIILLIFISSSIIIPFFLNTSIGVLIGNIVLGLFFSVFFTTLLHTLFGKERNEVSTIAVILIFNALVAFIIYWINK